jgi:hypothetical protein
MYASLHIIRVIKSRKMRCLGFEAFTGEVRKVLVRKPEGKATQET